MKRESAEPSASSFDLLKRGSDSASYMVVSTVRGGLTLPPFFPLVVLLHPWTLSQGGEQDDRVCEKLTVVGTRGKTDMRL